MVDTAENERYLPPFNKVHFRHRGEDERDKGWRMISGRRIRERETADDWLWKGL